mgnify:CR=1 FL=1
MYCTYCNFENASINKFCESCGNPLNETLADTQPLRTPEYKNNKSISRKKPERKKLNMAVFSKLFFVVLLGCTVIAIAVMISRNNIFGNVLGIGGLPTEAELAFDDWVQNDWLRADDPHIDYTIVSESKATGNFEGDEMWCIVTDTNIQMWGAKVNHFLLTREQLYWDVGAIDNPRYFSQVGCDNW